MCKPPHPLYTFTTCQHAPTHTHTPPPYPLYSTASVCCCSHGKVSDSRTAINQSISFYLIQHSLQSNCHRVLLQCTVSSGNRIKNKTLNKKILQRVVKIISLGFAGEIVFIIFCQLNGCCCIHVLICIHISVCTIWQYLQIYFMAIMNFVLELGRERERDRERCAGGRQDFLFDADPIIFTLGW